MSLTKKIISLLIFTILAFGASAWGNDLEVSVFVVDKDGVFTLCETNNEVIQIQIQCVAYDDQYDYERFKDK